MDKTTFVKILSAYYPDFLIEALWTVRPIGLEITEEQLKEVAQRFPCPSTKNAS